jgi:hypothetical protein
MNREKVPHFVEDNRLRKRWHCSQKNSRDAEVHVYQDKIATMILLLHKVEVCFKIKQI